MSIRKSPLIPNIPNKNNTESQVFTCVVTSDDTCAPLNNKNGAPPVKLLNKTEKYRIVRQTMFTLGSGSGVWQSRLVSIVVWKVSEKLKMC